MFLLTRGSAVRYITPLYARMPNIPFAPHLNVEDGLTCLPSSDCFICPPFGVHFFLVFCCCCCVFKITSPVHFIPDVASTLRAHPRFHTTKTLPSRGTLQRYDCRAQTSSLPPDFFFILGGVWAARFCTNMNVTSCLASCSYHTAVTFLTVGWSTMMQPIYPPASRPSERKRLTVCEFHSLASYHRTCWAVLVCIKSPGSFQYAAPTHYFLVGLHIRPVIRATPCTKDRFSLFPLV